MSPATLQYDCAPSPVTVQPTQNWELIRSVLTHPKIWPHISDDGTPAAADFQLNPQLLYILAHDGEGVIGVWLFAPHNSICWEAHTAVLPEAYGARARQAALDIAAWIWANTRCERIVTVVPSYNRLAERFAKRAGMRAYGRNPRSWRKHGKYYDLILLGMSKPLEGLCPQL